MTPLQEIIKRLEECRRKLNFEMHYEIGDVVEVKSLEEIMQLGDVGRNGDIWFKENGADVCFPKEMKRYCGQRCMIYSVDVMDECGLYMYRIFNDDDANIFTELMFKRVDVLDEYDKYINECFDDSIICDWLKSFK